MRIALIGLVTLLAIGCGSSHPGTPTPFNDPNKATIKMDSFTVPGATGKNEVFRCQYFPPTGSDLYFTRMHSQMTTGSHHLIVFRVNDANAGGLSTAQHDCTQIETPKGFDAILYGAQELDQKIDMPAGVAVHLDATHGLYFQSHYLNVTGADLTADVEFDFTSIDHAKVQQLAGQIFLSNFGLNIPPGMQQATRSCTVPADLNAIVTQGHMHRHGTALDGFLDGQSVYHTNNWDSPVANIYASPGLPMKQGQTVRWTCSYNNDTNAPLVFGNSAATNEMCIFGGIYYPAPEGMGNTWFCLNSQP